MTRLLQMSEAAQQRMEKATIMEKNAHALAQAIKQSPEQVLQMAKVDPYKFAEQLILKKMQDEAMDPNERRAVQAEQEAQRYRQHIEAQQQQEQAYHQEMQKNQRAQHWEKEILGAIESDASLPRDPFAIGLVAQNMLDAKRHGFEVDAKEAVAYTNQQLRSLTHSTLGKMTSDQLIKFLGDDLVNKVRQHTVDQVLSPRKEFSKAPNAVPQDANSPYRAERKFKSWAEKQQEFERRART